MRRLAHVINQMQGRRKPLNWRIMLDDEYPLLVEIMGTMIPRDFYFSDLKYSGKSDPLVHIRGTTRDWYHKLLRGNIRSFEQMCQELAEQFRGAVAPENDMMELMGMKQEENKSLRDFLKRYHQTVLDLGAFNHP